MVQKRGGGRARSTRSFKPLPSDAARRRAESGGGNDFDSIFLDTIPGVFTPPEGDNVVRIIEPTWENAEHYGYDLFVHYGIGPDECAYLCLEKMLNEKCPICEERKRAHAASEDEEYVKSLRPSQRVAVWIINRDKEEDGPQIWNMPKKMDDNFTNLCVDKRTGELIQIVDPYEGFDIEFTRKGKGLKTKYVGEAISRHPSPLSDDPAQLEEWREFVFEHPIPDVLNFYSYEYIQNVFGGGAASAEEPGSGEEEAGEEAPPPPPHRGRVRPSAGKVETEEEDDDAKASPPSRRGSLRSRLEKKEPVKAKQHTWDEIHTMNLDQMEELIAEEDLDPDLDNIDSEEQLQDHLCELLEIPSPSDDAGEEEAGEEDRASKLRKLRQRRNRG